MAMSDLVKRLRDHWHWGMTTEAADRIEDLERELAAEKALADGIMAAWQANEFEPAWAAYRKARGL